jgi:small subunit ribosomal protein S6
MYESIFICPGELADDSVQGALDKVKTVITRADGKVMTAELWGRRRLAYPIEKSREGHYAYIIFSGSSKIPSLLDRHYNVTDNILRGLTVKIDPHHLDKIGSSLKAVSEEGTAVAQPNVKEAPAAPQAQETSVSDQQSAISSQL